MQLPFRRPCSPSVRRAERAAVSSARENLIRFQGCRLWWGPSEKRSGRRQFLRFWVGSSRPGNGFIRIWRANRFGTLIALSKVVRALRRYAEQSGERPAVIRDLVQRGAARGTAPKGAFSEASDWPVGVRGPSSGEGRWPNGFLGESLWCEGVDWRARLQSGKGLHRSCLSDILEAVPGAERMSRWRATSLKGCTTRRRLQWEQGYLWKIEGLDGAPERSWHRTVWSRAVQARRDNARRPWNTRSK